MAGIGFELRKVLSRESLSSTMQAYLYAGIISSGPFVLSIFAILLIGLVTAGMVVPPSRVVQFQVSVTYLIAASLIVSGIFQLAFTRFTSDRLFEKRDDLVLSSYNTVCILLTALAGTIGLVLMFTVFAGQTLAYRLCMLMGFVALCNIWMAVIFLTSIKQYWGVLLTFFLGYGLSVVCAIALYRYGTEGLLAGFIIGQMVLLLVANLLIWHNYPSSQYLSGEFFHRKEFYHSLVWVGVFFNLGIWVDKFMFWFSDAGQTVIGPLRASLIYDIPIFIAYLSVIPGMAMFLLRLEADFVDHYDGFYDAIRKGGTLREIQEMQERMVRSARTGLYEIFKIQALVCLLVIAFGGVLLQAIGISPLYRPLLQVDVVAVGLQVILLGVLNIFFYLDRRDIVLMLTGLFLALNISLTGLTLWLGPSTYGYGFASALLVTVLVGVYWMDHCFRKLEFHTYMMRKYA